MSLEPVGNVQHGHGFLLQRKACGGERADECHEYQGSAQGAGYLDAIEYRFD
ncbi:hypothetical protein [Marinobacter sp. F4216]|uniref:hypothetical protein n=1 Tax=Marinobacter sp. F4216 TaxID=2874281 RepID=UPI001CBD356D|nr:hypothetical protein [Marinobacter sp. F4216]MBZ2168097.1 hypothetical protein [Marinobacter sp. F4216]